MLYAHDHCFVLHLVILFTLAESSFLSKVLSVGEGPWTELASYIFGQKCLAK